MRCRDLAVSTKVRKDEMPQIKATPLTPELFDYLESHSLLAHPILERLAAETAKLPDANMQIPRHQGGLMHMLVKLLGVKEAIEVGCYTGYSAIAVAAALPADGRLTTFDIDPKTSAVAQQYFRDAGLAGKIDLIVGDARKTLTAFVQRRGTAFASFAFIDANKIGYDIYYEACIEALRPNGLLLVDNAFRDGEVLAPAVKDLSTQTVDRLSRKIKTDMRVEATMIPVADGVILVRKL